MSTLRSRRARAGETRLLVSGAVLIGAGIVLLLADGRSELAALALVLGAGLCISSPFPVRSARLRATLLGGVFLAFVATRLGLLVADSEVTVAALARLVAEAMVVGVVFELAYASTRGLTQLAEI